MLAAALTTAPPVVGATRTWDNGSGDGLWSTAANWSLNALPVPGDTVIFDGTSATPATINVPVNVAILQMNAGYTSTVTQAAGQAVTLTTSYTQSAGTFAAGASTMSVAGLTTVNAAGTFNAGPATLSLNGGLTVAGAFNGGTSTTNVTGTTTVNAGGNFNGNTATLNLTGALTVNAGAAFTSTAGTMTVTGAVTLAAGVFTHNSGTVVLSTSNVNVALAGGATFNNVQFLSGTKTISSGAMTAVGTLTLTGGAVNTGTVAAQGAISVASTFTGGTGTLLINGTAPQTWTGGGASSDLPLVNINNPAGTLTMTGIFRTTRNWTFTASGGLTASGSSVIFAGTQTITGTHTLGAVEIAGVTVTIATGTTLTAAGNLTLTSGILNQAGATGTLAAQGDISIATAYTGGTATLLINGSVPQTWSGTANSAAAPIDTLNVVNINNPAGTLTITASLRTTHNWTFTASGGLTASGSSIIFAGGIITGTHTLGAIEIAGAVTIAAGTTVSAGGNLTLTSGTLTTGTLAAQGNISIAAAYTGGTTTLLINGTTPQVWSGTSNGVTDTLNVVNINNPASTLTITASLRTTRNWTFTASGGLNAAASSIIFAGGIITGSHSLGAVEVAGGVTIAAGTILTVPGPLTLTSGTLTTGTLAAQGDVSAAAAFTGGTTILLIDGAGPQTLLGTQSSIAGGLPNVDINKTSGLMTISGTLRTGRNWTVTNATAGLVVTGSTLVFTGSSATTITGSHTLNNVEIRGGTISIAAGTTLTVAGTTDLFSGGLNQIGATGTLAAQGDVFARIGFTGGGTATLLINGTLPQTLTGFHTALAGAMPVVNIAKPSGTLTIAGTIRTGRNWTYTSGGLVVAGSTIVFNGTLTISGDHALNNVEMHAGDVTVNAGDTLAVGGLLTMTDGNLAGGTVDALGDMVLGVGYDGEGGTYRIAGTTDQTFTGFADTLNTDMANLVIDKSSGTLHLVGTFRMLTASWTWLQGTVDAGTSTVYFDTTVTITGTHSLFNVYLTGGPHTVTAGDTLTALGALTLDNGTIDIGTIAGAGDITQLSTFDGGSGRLVVSGGGNQSFSGLATTAAGNLPDLEINKSGGTVTLSGTIRTTNDWTYVAGVVDADGSTAVFAGALTIDSGGMSFNDVLVNAGTAALASNLTVAGDLTVAAGTLAMGSNIIFAAGDVTVNGALTTTTGTLDMNGLTGQTLGGSAAIALYNLSINDPAGVTQTTTVSVAGTLDLSGPYAFNGQSLSIAHAITGTPNNLTADAAATLIIFGNGGGIVIPSSLTDLLNLTITNPNGAALAGSLNVFGTFTLGGGNLDAGAFVLSIGPAGSVSRTSGHVIGQLQKWVAVGAGVTVVYEIGDATAYAPVSLTFGTVGVTGQITAFTTPGEHPNIGSSIIDPAQDVNRWWSLVNAGVGFSTLDTTFTWVPADLDASANPGGFVVGKWDGSWTMPAPGANTATTITAFGMTSLSEFAVGEAGADLMMTKDGPAFVTAGDPAGFDYTLTVHNNGPADNVTGFTISDTLPAGLTFQAAGSDGRCGAVGQVVTCANVLGLASGADDPFVIHVRLAPSAGAGTVLTNTATVTSSGSNDADPSNDAGSITTTVVLVVPTATPSPTPTGSVPDTSAFYPEDPIVPLILVIGFAAWILLVSGLAMEGTRRGRRRFHIPRR